MTVTMERLQVQTSTPTPTDVRKRGSKKRGHKPTTKPRNQHRSDEPKAKKPRGKKTAKVKYPVLGRGETVTAWIGLNEEMCLAFELMIIDAAERRGWRDPKRSKPAHGLMVIDYARALSRGELTVPDLCQESRQVVAEVFMGLCDSRDLTWGVVDAA